MKKEGEIILFIITILAIGFISSASIENTMHLTIQVTNSSGIMTGNFLFVFNISTTSSCNNVVYTNSSNMTTDSLGQVSIYLNNVTMNFSDQYWLCYYRNGVLMNSSKISPVPYAFYAKNVPLSGVYTDANFNASIFNITTTGTLSATSVCLNGTCQSSWGTGSGTNYWGSNGSNIYNATAYVGIGNTNPTIPLVVGQGATLNSADAQIAIQRIVTNSAGNSHSFSDSSDINFTATNLAHNSFDERINIIGSQDMNHVAGFQSAPTYDNSGTIGYLYGFIDAPIITAGTISYRLGLKINDPTKSSGTISNNFGIYVAEQTAGNVNYAIYTEGATKSVFMGNVGIGTISPAFKLDVYGQAIQLFNSSNGGISEFIIGSTKGDATTRYFDIMHNASDTTNGALYIIPYSRTQSNAMVTFQSGGNVGIGTTSPSQKLDVRGTGNFSGTIYINNATDISTLSSSGNPFDQDLNTTNNAFFSGLNVSNASGNNIILTRGSGVFKERIFSNTNSKNILVIANYSSDTQGIAVEETGNIGIGTSAPSALLDIYGTSNLTLAYIREKNSYTSFYEGSVRSIENFVAGSDAFTWSIGTNIQNDVNERDFQIRDSLSTIRFTIQNTSGNVGIGTTNPAKKMDVNGDVFISSGLNSFLVNASIGNNGYEFANNSGTLRWIIRTTTTEGGSNSGANMVFNSRDDSGSNNIDVMTLQRTGNVGIGTTSPTQVLDVRGSANFSGMIYYNNGTAVSSSGTNYWGSNGSNIYNTTAYIGIGTSSPSDRVEINGNLVINKSSTSSYAVINRQNNATQDSALWFKTNNVNKWILGQMVAGSGGVSNQDYFTIASYEGSWTNRLTIQNGSGNVGIGTANPGTNLEVNGTTGIIIRNGTNTNNIFTNGDGQLAFGSGKTSMVIDDGNGYVGINTSSPLALLHLASSNFNILDLQRTIAANVPITFNNTNYGMYAGMNTYGDFAISSNPDLTSSPDFVFNVSSGNMGIGISPGAALDVAAPGNVLTNYTARFFSSGSVAGAGGILFAQGTQYYAIKAYTAGTSSTTGYLTFDFINQTNGSSISSGIFTINGLGRVGIGTTSPTQKLDVRGSANFSGDIYINNGTAVSTLSSGTNYWGSNGSNIYNETGYLGVGTSSPLYSLQINRTTADANVLGIGRSDGGQANLNFLNSSGRTWALYYVGDSGTRNLAVYDYQKASNIMTFQGGTGNVGIGTTSPSAPLQINGTSGSNSLYITSSGTTTAQISSLSTIPNSGRSVLIFGVANSSATEPSTWQIGINTAGTGVNDFIVREVLASSTTNVRFVIQNTSGNVGIGTTSPDSLLNLNAPTTVSLSVINISDTSGAYSWDFANGGNPTSRIFIRGYNSTGNEAIRFDPQSNSFFLGNLGIGTSTPAGLLNINQTVSATNTLVLSTNFGNGNIIALNPFITSVNNAGFEIRNVSSSTDFMVIAPSGNVGIGTTSPTQVLEVAGNVNISANGNLTVNGTAKFVGVRPSVTLQGNISGSTVFNAFAPLVPNVGDNVTVNGIYHSFGDTLSYTLIWANRNSATQITFYSENPSTGALTNIAATNGTALYAWWTVAG